MLDRHAFPEILGGAHRYLYDVARKLAERGHQVHFIHCSLSPDKTSTEKREGVIWHRYHIKESGSLLNNYQYITHTYKIARQILHSEGLDLVNFQCGRVPLKLYSPGEFSRIPFIYTCQADTAYEYLWDYQKILQIEKSPFKKLKEHIKFPSHYYWHRYCLKKALERTDGIITLSDYVRNTMLKHYGQKYAPKFRRIPSGVDVNVFRPPQNADEKQAIRKQLGLPIDKTLFLTVRRMALRMGWFNLEEAIKLLFERHPELRTQIMFLFVGGGEIFDKVKETAYQLGILPHIIFTGPRYEEVPLYYRAADCFVLPTEELEGFGIVSIEAFASGIPVIGTPRSAVPEVLRELDPELVTSSHLPEGLYEGIFKMVKKLKAGEIDSAYIRQVAVSKFSWEVIVQKIEDFMRELIATKSRQ